MAARHAEQTAPGRHARGRHLRELAEAATRYDGDLLVLTPWRPFGGRRRGPRGPGHALIHTVSRLEDLRELTDRDPRARFVLEQLTSMRATA